MSESVQEQTGVNKEEDRRGARKLWRVQQRRCGASHNFMRTSEGVLSPIPAWEDFKTVTPEHLLLMLLNVALGVEKVTGGLRGALLLGASH